MPHYRPISPRSTAVFISGVVLLLVGMCHVANAQGAQRFLDHGVRLTFSSTSPKDSQAITAAWGQGTNGVQNATGYRVRITYPLSPERVGSPTTLSTAFRVVLPCKGGDSALVRVAVWARRAGIEGTDSVWGSRWVKRKLGTTAACTPIPQPPAGSSLDTINIFTTADGQLRPGILKVDSTGADGAPGTYPYSVRVTRALPNGGSTTFNAVRQSSGVNWNNGPFSAGIVGGMSPCLDGSDMGVAYRWNPALFPPLGEAGDLHSYHYDPNGVYPWKAGYAAIAQLPVDSLIALTKMSALVWSMEEGEVGSRYAFQKCYGADVVPRVLPKNQLVYGAGFTSINIGDGFVVWDRSSSAAHDTITLARSGLAYEQYPYTINDGRKISVTRGLVWRDSVPLKWPQVYTKEVTVNGLQPMTVWFDTIPAHKNSVTIKWSTAASSRSIPVKK